MDWENKVTVNTYLNNILKVKSINKIFRKFLNIN